jgi:uncharacterized protein
MRLTLAAALLAASPATAGVQEALDEVLLPGFARFSAAAIALAEDAAADCTPVHLAAPYEAVWTAWLPVGVFLLGPTEAAAPHIAFWPDPRGFTPKTLNSLIAAESPVIDDPAAFGEVSVAGKGLFALERLLFDGGFNSYGPESYTCRLVRAVADDLAAQAITLEAGWRDGYAVTLTSAGAPDNATFLDEGEAMRALYTQVLGALEFTAENRLGEPMGSFERARPTRAEARLSARALANVIGATEAVVALADALADWDLPLTHAALDAVFDAGSKIEDAAFADVENPSARFRLEVLQQKVEGVETAIEEELGLALGLTPGFNASDGD